jgi:hypothetical protein
VEEELSKERALAQNPTGMGGVNHITIWWRVFQAGEQQRQRSWGGTMLGTFEEQAGIQSGWSE